MSVENRLAALDLTMTIIAVVLSIWLIAWVGDRNDARECESEHHHHWTGHVCRRDDGTNFKVP